MREVIATEVGRRAGRAGEELRALVRQACERDVDLFSTLVGAGIDAELVLTTASELTRLPPAPRLLLKNPGVPVDIDAQGIRSAGGIPIGSVQGRVWIAFCDPEAARAAMFSDDVVVCLALAADLRAARERFAAVHPDTGLDTVAIQAVTPEAIEAWRQKNALGGPRTEVVAGPPASMTDDAVDEVFANNLDPGARRLLRRVQRGRLKRFRIERMLGRGTMATVYLARDRVDGAMVAIKVLEPHLRDDTIALERFRRELRTLQALRHPRIVAPLDGDIDGGVPWLTCRFLDGGTLADLVERAGPLPAAAALPVFAAVLEALVHAHAHGVVHRDVKPHNVLLAVDGAVCLADFGMARAAGDVPLTRTGATLGTPAYMAPEQALGGVVDERSDLFACGLLLHFLLAGKNPFLRSTVAATMAAMASGEVPALPPSVRVPARVRRVLEALLAPSPSARPPDAAHALAALAPLLSKLLPADEVVRRLLVNPAAFAGVGVVDDEEAHDDRTVALDDDTSTSGAFGTLSAARDTVALPVVSIAGDGLVESSEPSSTPAPATPSAPPSRPPAARSQRAATLAVALLCTLLALAAAWWRLR